MLKQQKKTEIETQVKKVLNNFIIDKGLTKKDGRLINPFDFLKKIELAEEFMTKCTMKITYQSEEDNYYLKLQLQKANSLIINEYL